ncbi:MAG: dTDP-4-dehydrorhamnose 3,5-epimerase [Nitrospinales bacterium]|jgi:dTDP-4-dehydrorhamnose 3,5-epimerase
MKFQETKIPGMVLIDLDVYKDSRGSFLECYQKERYKEHGIDVEFVQDNHSHSTKNVLRGMHFQVNHPQGHLVYVVRGDIFDVGVDLRRGSPTFGQWLGFRLSESHPQQLFLPAGVAHGFCTLSDKADILYKCTDYFDSNDEGGLLWCDSDLKIDWPTDHPIIHNRDSGFPLLKEISDLPNI